MSVRISLTCLESFNAHSSAPSEQAMVRSRISCAKCWCRHVQPFSQLRDPEPQSDGTTQMTYISAEEWVNKLSHPNGYGYGSTNGDMTPFDTCLGNKSPIAVIGMSCRFPGDVTNPEKLWKLCAEGRSAWSTIPQGRFNGDAFYHTLSENIGTSNVRGGHFLKEDVSLFDATFFNFSSDVASSMDPQIRLQLESTYEAFESAGIPISKIAGTSTSVFAGAIFRDYHDSLLRDPETMPRYYLTGNGAAMISNRISHFFDLRGPSVTVDTGCSTGLTALHLGCQSIRAGESKIAVIGGANVMINPDMFIAIFLGADGKSYTFDSRAQGYGRGEGVACIVLKSLENALRDGDPVRAVIRETALNQDGRTPTITSPSQDAQANLIRDSYERVGLNPATTNYVEAHGTGTKTGDPIEVAAIGSVLGKGRPKDNPLYIGSVKSNIGHLEAASGLAALIKVAMAFERGGIPPSINFEEANPDIRFDEWNLKVPRKIEPWPLDQVRRASISNFGYGGTNTHVILDGAVHHRQKLSTLTNGDRHTSDNRFQNDSDCKPFEEWRVFILSAKDEQATKAMITNLREHLEQLESQNEEISLRNLAYTLGQRRSVFPWTAATPARSLSELVQAIDAGQVSPNHSSKLSRLGFVFTGQGAQWHAMGRELLGAYPVFRESIQQSERYLIELGAPWSLVGELMRDEATTRVNEPAMSLSLCVAVQISLVQLLRSWNINPTAVTGHSSGEISAAYAAGAIDTREALALAYFRGVVLNYSSEGVQIRGSMLAVGLGPDGVQPYLQKTSSGKAVIACMNSPSSVTLSGDLEAIQEVEDRLNEDGVFARKLKVKVAYHSHHMEPLAKEYSTSIRRILSQKGDFGSVLYSSPVTGKLTDSAEELTPEHWVKNMVQPVLFSQSLRNMCIDGHSNAQVRNHNVDTIIEIGPHGALAGPIRQILSLPELKGFDISYGSCLHRGQDAVKTMQNLVCLLLSEGYPVDMKAVNFPKGDQGLEVIHNLPPYPWNHSVPHWVEPRVNKEYRRREHAPHDLLGTRINNNNPLEPTWRHVIRPSEVPWVRDHLVQSDIVYPGAGCIAMAIEAVRQLFRSSERTVTAYSLRDVRIMKALVIPDAATGVEVQISLRHCGDDSLEQGWQEFNIYSVDDECNWNQHCRGLISPVLESDNEGAHGWSRIKANSNSTLDFETAPGAYTRRLDTKDFFGKLQVLGINHGPSFQNLLTIQSGQDRSVATFSVPDTASMMPGRCQKSHIIHPITLDALFQAAYSALSGSQARELGAAIPRSIKSMFVSAGISSDPGHHFQTFTTLKSQSPQGFEVSIATVTEGNTQAPPVLALDGFYYQSLGDPLTSEQNAHESDLCLTARWENDLSLLRPEHLKASLTSPPDPSEAAIIQDLRRATYHIIHDTLAILTTQDLNNLDWHHKILVEWMKYQDKRAEQNELAPNSSKWARSSRGLKQLLFDNVSSKSVNGEMLCRLGRQLVPILRKEIGPLELMLENKLLYKYYEKALRVDRSLGQVEKIINLFAHHNPRARILEIGGGTGACTGPVLRSLGGGDAEKAPQFAHYDFTDVSSGFFEMAREKFGAWGDLISYSKLDIEQDVIAQTFELGTYDLIIACQVLHATKAMKNTMTNVRKLLKPGGKLVMVETTQDALDVQMVFGTLPGWWLSEEQERKYSPNLSLQSWQRVLTETGFTGLDIDVRDCENDHDYAMSVIMTTAVTEDRPSFHPNVAIVYAQPSPPRSWLENLKETMIASTLVTPTIETLDDVQPEGKDVIFVSEADQSTLRSMDSTKFSRISHVLNVAKGVLWVSRGGAINCERPEAALHTGLLRTLRLENAGKRYISLDLDPKREAWTTPSAAAILDIFRFTFNQARDKAHIDFEYAERDSYMQVLRIQNDIPQNIAVAPDDKDPTPEMQAFHQPDRELRMSVQTPGLLDSLVFRDDPSVGNPLPDGFVEIEPRAFGLNFRDIMVAMGQLQEKTMGFECSGLITRVGPNASHDLKVGDRVCALTTRGHWANFIRIHWTGVGRIPDSMSWEQAASIPMVFVTAYYSICESARLQRGETILIHAATGGVGQAAIILSQHIGAEIFATVGSQEKRDFLIDKYGIASDHIFSSRDRSFAAMVMNSTNGKGVDVVLNSLAGPLLQESWNCVATLGRFVEIGKRDIQQNKSLNMEHFGRAVSFSAVDLIHLGNHKGESMHRVLHTVLRLLGEEALKPVAPLTVYPISEIQKAFRLMQAGKHFGKIVIKPNRGDLVKVIPQKKSTRLAPDASYLLVGGLGGIGKSIAQWLVQQGAMHIIILSRSAGSQSSSQPFLEELRAVGCNVIARNCDIADMKDLTRVMADVMQDAPPVRGVIQAAMVLNDSVFEHMSFPKWQAAIRPKVEGSLNLHNYFTKLDFFVMLSSATGVLGNPSQANYASGGTFQDALARNRTSNGLPAVSIDLGMVKSVGYVSETAGVAERLARIGYRPLEEDEVLRIIAAAVRDPRRELHASQIITGLAPFAQADDILWRQEPRFQGLKYNTLASAHANKTGQRSGNGKDGAGAGGSFKASLAGCASFDAAAALITAAIVAKLAEMFMIPETQISAAKPMSEYGVDSLVAVELRNWLIARTQAEMSIFDVLQSPSLAALADKIAAKKGFVNGGAAAAIAVAGAV